MWHGLLVAHERLPGYGLTPFKPGSNALYEGAFKGTEMLLETSLKYFEMARRNPRGYKRRLPEAKSGLCKDQLFASGQVSRFSTSGDVVDALPLALPD